MNASLPARHLSERPDFDQLKRQAKELLSGFAARESTAVAEVCQYYPCAPLDTLATTRGQGSLQSLVDDFRNGTTTRATILRTGFPSWFLRMGLRVAGRKGNGLSFAGPPRSCKTDIIYDTGTITVTVSNYPGKSVN